MRPTAIDAWCIVIGSGLADNKHIVTNRVNVPPISIAISRIKVDLNEDVDNSLRPTMLDIRLADDRLREV